jgi:hypothetical protein
VARFWPIWGNARQIPSALICVFIDATSPRFLTPLFIDKNMHPRVKQLYDMMEEINKEDEIPIQDALIMIGILKILQSGIMFRAKGDLFPKEDQK